MNSPLRSLRRATLAIGWVISAALLPAQAQTSPWTPPENTENANSQIGEALDLFQSYTPEWVVIDAFAKSSPLSFSDCASGDAITVTSALTFSRGWVTSATRGGICLGSTLYNHQDNAFPYPTGEYVVLWEGDGTVNVGDASGTPALRETTPPGAPIRRGVFTVASPQPGGIWMSLEPHDAGSGRFVYPRNVRVIVPGGVCGPSGQPPAATRLDFLSGCRSARGGEGAASCSDGQQCYDFEPIHYDRFHDPASAMNNPKAVFHPASLDRWKKYRLFRFTTWLETDGGGVPAEIERWDQRSVKDKQSFGDGGVPYEYMIALSNLLNADMWISVPYKTNDDYSRRFARLVKGEVAGQPGLRSDRKVYVEYTNEAWNPSLGFPNWYMRLKEGCVPPAPYTPATAHQVPPERQWDWIDCPMQGSRSFATRATKIMDLWSGVFTGADSRRLVRILSGWGDSEPDWDRNVLAVSTTVAGGRPHFDVFTFGPYFGIEVDDALLLRTPAARRLDTLFTELRSTHVPRAIDNIRQTAALARRPEYGLGLVGYESGQHLITYGRGLSQADERTLNKLYIAANGDARMGELYTTLLHGWRAHSSGVLNHMSNCTHWDLNGYWGLLRNQTQPRRQSPKYDAVMRFIESSAPRRR